MSFVYAIGNALVDIEVNVTDDELVQMGIEKGVMTLIDEEKIDSILGAIPNSKTRACGGSACNTIFGATQLGTPTAFSGRVANDDYGQFYIQTLMDNNIQTQFTLDQHQKIGNTGKTGICIVLITPDADRTLTTFLGESAHFSKEDVNESLLVDSEWVYIEGYLTTSPSSLEAALVAKSLAYRHQKKIALTFSDPNVVNFCRDGFNALLDNGPNGTTGSIDLLFCNEQEALTYTETTTISDALPLLKTFAKQFAITLGEKGAIVFDGTECHDISAPSVNALDTNGAGDLFAGCVFAGLYQNKELADSAQLGCYAASQLVMQYGPRMNKETLFTTLSTIQGASETVSL
jgi:sugar/nucleoside kinase (ribokinase family)